MPNLLRLNQSHPHALWFIRLIHYVIEIACLQHRFHTTSNKGKQNWAIRWFLFLSPSFMTRTRRQDSLESSPKLLFSSAVPRYFLISPQCHSKTRYLLRSTPPFFGGGGGGEKKKFCLISSSHYLAVSLSLFRGPQQTKTRWMSAAHK